jgi:hypothetical protein
MTRRRKEYSPADGQRMIAGLAQAAEIIAAEERAAREAKEAQEVRRMRWQRRK